MGVKNTDWEVTRTSVEETTWAEEGEKWRQNGYDCIMRGFITCTLRKMVLYLPIKEDEMGGARSTCEREEKYTFFIENPEG